MTEEINNSDQGSGQVGAVTSPDLSASLSNPTGSASEYAKTGVLTDEQNHIMDWLGESSNTLTRDGKFELWKNNMLANRPYFAKENPVPAGVTAYLIGAGPSLEKNVNELANVSERGILVTVEAALRFLQSRGITPEYCVSIDGSDKMADMIEGCDTSRITLICTPSANPRMVAAWKGPRYFVTTPHQGVEKQWNSFHRTRIVKAKCDIKQGDELFLDEQYEVVFGGVSSIIQCGGNVSTAGHDFCLRYLRAQQVVFVGMDLSWQYESHHYAGHEHLENTRARTQTFPMGHKDVNGNDVYTNFSLMAFKRWHEALARNYAGTVVNATEGGILGIGEKGVRNPFVEFMTLAEAIAKYTPKKSSRLTMDNLPAGVLDDVAVNV